MQEPQNRLTTESAPATANTATVLALPDTVGPAEQKPMHMLLSQQLQVLESPHFVWRGEVWPGQTLEWQMRQETDPQANDSATPATHEVEAGWESHLKLALPHLGTLNVHIKLDAHQAFSIRMVPERPEAEPLLQKNQVQLVKQLAAAGCTLHAVTVRRDAGA